MAGFTFAQTNRAITILVICSFVLWALQLGGIAGLQAACGDELLPELNNVDNIRNYLGTASNLASTLAATPPSSALSNVVSAQTFAATLQALQGVTSRTVMNIYTFTPDYSCSLLYRYQWFNTFLNFIILILIGLALATQCIDNARIALSALIVYSTVLSSGNAQAIITFEKFVPQSTLTRGKVFFAGCVGTAFFNMLMVMVMGFRSYHDDIAPPPSAVVPNGDRLETPTKGGTEQVKIQVAQE